MIGASALVVGGLFLLSAGADRFVLAAARLSRVWGMSPILIGALVVGMGTSAPEFLVSVVAAAGGGLDLAVGGSFSDPLLVYRNNGQGELEKKAIWISGPIG